MDAAVSQPTLATVLMPPTVMGAGSERVGRSEAVGERLEEAKHINRSLAALGDVMAALAAKAPHVPFRNSKLTQLLQDSLAGQAKAMMFIHVAPEVRPCSARSAYLEASRAHHPRKTSIADSHAHRTVLLAMIAGPLHARMHCGVTCAFKRDRRLCAENREAVFARPQASSCSESVSTLGFGARVAEITLGQARANTESGAVFEAREARRRYLMIATRPDNDQPVCVRCRPVIRQIADRTTDASVSHAHTLCAQDAQPTVWHGKRDLRDTRLWCVTYLSM